MRHEVKNGKLILYPEGRIDSNTSAAFEAEIGELLSLDPGHNAEVNMEGVEYVSSAGLRCFLKLKKAGNDLEFSEMSQAVYEIFQMTGFTELFKTKKALRRMSVDGCEVIGRGFYGTVYRVDEDTIVKVYESPDSIPMIENEQRRAKQAFLKGIPTAISYDAVKIGNSYGSVFEMLKARTFNDIIISDPDNADETIKKYVDFLKLVHGTEMDQGSLPYASDVFMDYLDTVKHYLNDSQYEKLKTYLEKFPKDEHVVHGDFQMKNVMLVEGEPMLIDMDTLSAGHPIFDLAGLYVTYKSFEEDEPDNSIKFLGITNEMCDRIWNGIMVHYFDDHTSEERTYIEDRIKLAAVLRFLYILDVTDLKNGELGMLRIKHSCEHIEELLEKTDGLYF